jgi:hypothetical protein
MLGTKAPGSIPSERSATFHIRSGGAEDEPAPRSSHAPCASSLELA